MNILVHLLLLFLFFICHSSLADFSPNTADYDAYGLKFAANNLMIVQAQNDYTQFLIQFAPYTDNVTQTDNRSCLIEYDDTSQFVYAVALGKNQSTYNIFFVGEMIDLSEDDNLENRTFVGVLNYTGSLTTIDCYNGFKIATQYIPKPLPHQEHLIMVTDPFGSVAYGFSNLFTFSYVADTDNLTVYFNNSLSLSTTFFPYAVDYDGSYGIVSGFLDNGRNSRIKYIATVILFSVNTSPTIVTPISTWNYPTNGTTWQAGQTNLGADQYAPKFDMSVSINPNIKQALVGIQSLDTVFLFNYATTTLTLISSLDNGQAIGFGKGVVWLSYTSTSFAILANVYSMNYDWKSSQIYFYESTLTNTSTPISIFPNSQQPLYSYMDLIFLNIISTPDDLVLMDDLGNMFVMVSVPAGYYASTVGPSVQTLPAFSTQLPCIPGTYKNVTGIRRCLPCPTGTKNDGTNVTILNCVACASNSFCPFGSTSDAISNDQLSNVIQAVAYPKSPDNAELDDILFLTLFSIGSTPRCVALSAIFWTLIVAAIVTPIGSVMLIIKYCVTKPSIAARYKKVEKVFKQTDLIFEGEVWIGGLATFCVVVLLISCYVFSAKYYNSYPIETAGPSTYTCDTTIRNAQFTTTLQSSTVPVSDDLQEIINLLNEQTFNLNVAFINTAYNCTSDPITITYLLGTNWLPISNNISCNSSSYILSISVLLPFRPITVLFNLPNIYTIGGLRVGLSGPGQVQSSKLTLLDLGFSQTFSQSGRMVGQDPNIALELTKVINDTSPLVTGDDEVVSGLWISSAAINYYESFFSDNDYLNAPAVQSTNLTVAITETPYYIVNTQDPIGRLPEIIFHNFLFTIMVIEMFALIFVIFILLIIPLFVFLIRRCKPDFAKKKNRTETYHQQSPGHDVLKSPTSHSNELNSNKNNVITTKF